MLSILISIKIMQRKSQALYRALGVDGEGGYMPN